MSRWPSAVWYAGERLGEHGLALLGLAGAGLLAMHGRQP